MDGVVSYTNATTGTAIYLQDILQTAVVDVNSGSTPITGYTPYWDTEYSARLLEEFCDNGGDEDHGCDRLCRIVDGWECFNYYHHLLGLENPFYTSICQEIDYPTLDTDIFGCTTAGDT